MFPVAVHIGGNFMNDQCNLNDEAQFTVSHDQ